ncbi:MAG: SDR family NAD(P)-dependent oxidoreductase [Thermoleophilaceae bacterium]
MAAHFSGKVCVVTGAGSGIGRSTALLFARLGANVHVAELDEERARAVVAEIEAAGGKATAHVTDVTDAAAVETLAEAVYAANGAVDVLHNNAGIGHGGPVEETTLEDWQRVIAVNLMGVVHGVHFFVPRMLAQGRPAHIVNTASLAGLVATPELVPYATTKHAVVGLTESLNAELAGRGIHVSAICPGIINTNIVATATMRGDLGRRQGRAVEFYERRGASPDVVAEAVVDAVRRKRLIRTTPRWHVAPSWAIRRLSPRLGQFAARATTRATTRLTGG